MASEHVNTVQITAYTPEGFRVYVNVDLIPANELDALMKANGYLAHVVGAKAGEIIEVMTHVSRRMHTNKKDGSITPVIAFYSENTALSWKYDHMYLNTPEQITEFEAVSGMQMMSIPEFEGDNFLERTAAKAAKYVMPLVKHIKVAAALKPYKILDGTTGETMKIQRFVDAPVVQEKSTFPITPAQWNTEVLALTKPLYSSSDRQKDSLNKAKDDGAISANTMTPQQAFEVMQARKQAAQESK